MDIVIHSLNGIITVMLIIWTGFAMERLGWFTESSVTLI